MNETQRRPWRRLHPGTWLPITILGLLMLGVNLCGCVKRTSPNGVLAFDAGHEGQWTYGWPLTFGRRSMIGTDTVSMNHRNRWFTFEDAIGFSPGRFVIDFLACAGVLLVVAYLSNRWFWTNGIPAWVRVRFSLRSFLAVSLILSMLIGSIGIAVRRNYQRIRDREQAFRVIRKAHYGDFDPATVVHLTLSGKITDQDLAYLRGFPSIERLDIGNQPVSGRGLLELTALPRLEWLRLQNTPITDGDLESLTHLKHLKWLDLRATNITDAGVLQLKRIEQLERVHLEDTLVTADGADKLRAALPHCRVDWSPAPPPLRPASRQP